MQAALPPMSERGWGRVLTIGSINETRPEAELSIYAALKSAQHNLSINLARQYAASGVTVNNLSPGLVATERNRWRRQDEASWTEIQRRSNPMGRAGTPEEIAAKRAAPLLGGRSVHHGRQYPGRWRAPPVNDRRRARDLPRLRAPEGSPGVRNRLLVLSVVGLTTPSARRIHASLPGSVLVAASNGRGQLWRGQARLRRQLVGLASHPNNGAVLIVGADRISADAVADAFR